MPDKTIEMFLKLMDCLDKDVKKTNWVRENSDCNVWKEAYDVLFVNLVEIYKNEKMEF